MRVHLCIELVACRAASCCVVSWLASLRCTGLRCAVAYGIVVKCVVL